MFTLHTVVVCLKIDLIFFFFSTSYFTFPIFSLCSLFTSPFLMKWCWFRLDSSVASQPCPPTPSRAHNPGLRCRSGWRRLECTDESALSVTITSPDCRSAARSVTPVTAHTLSPHTQKRSSIKPSSLLPKEFVFASLWKRTSYSRIELAAHSGPVLFCAPSGSSPTVFAFSRCGAELHWFPSAEQQYSRIALGRTEQGIRLPSLTPGVSFISQPSQARSLCASRAVRVLKAYPCNHIRPY